MNENSVFEVEKEEELPPLKWPKHNPNLPKKVDPESLRKETVATCEACIHHTVCAVYRPDCDDILAKGESCSGYLPNDMLRQHALKILKEFSKAMRPRVNMMGQDTLEMSRTSFEAIRHEFLDRK